MKNNFYTGLEKLKSLSNETLDFEEFIIKLKNIISTIAFSINLGKFTIENNEEYEIYNSGASKDCYQLNSSSNYNLVCKYYPINKHKFTVIEREKIQILNEIINLIYNEIKSSYKLYTENDIEAFCLNLIDKQKFDDYSIVSMSLNNYNFLKKYFDEKTDKIFNLYYKELIKLLDVGERIFLTNVNNIIALIKKDNIEEFLKFKKLIEIPIFSDIQDYISFDIRTGIYNVKNGDEAKNSIEKSLIALYMAEHVYKIEELVFTEEMEKTIIKEQRVLSLFPKALNNQEFTVFYQPKVDLNTNSIYGTEALVRWQKAGKIISPGEFIPILERENILYQLDFYVLECVCKDIRRWIDEKLDPVKVSINFSKKSIRSSNFINDLMNILNKYQISSEYIEIELTETVETLDSENLINFVNIMRQNNINVSIDDFGTGYSSLNLIKNLSANTIKIDKSFIDNIENTKDSVVVRNIINIAKELGIEVMAEGTETLEQVNILHSMGCNKIQGYYFDKPLPVLEFEERLSNRQFYDKRMKLVKEIK